MKEEVESVFDKLWNDGEEFEIGDLTGEVMYLPGHTPDHVGYKSKGLSSLVTRYSTQMLDLHGLTF